MTSTHLNLKVGAGELLLAVEKLLVSLTPFKTKP